MLWPTSRTVYVKHPSGAQDQIFFIVKTVAGLFMCGTVCDERTGLSFAIAAGSRQHSHIYRPWTLLAILLHEF
jgi:hypothetical protein